ncbi:hypothetical protein HDV06_002257 [Boothiomyces sp. JEL0866]|nr:hypothetical protein HDV06_002257 [Boothiomyces sp. JEL0866]
MPIFEQIYDAVIEYLVHAALIIAETSVCYSLYKKYRKTANPYSRNVLLLHLVIWFGILVGICLTTIVYSTLPDDYTTLLTSTLPEYEGQYLAYRSFYFIQLFTYQCALYGLFWVDYDRYIVLYELIKEKKAHYFIKACFGSILGIALGYICYNHISPANRVQWQMLQKDWTFHYVHACWFYVVCLTGIFISVSSIFLVYKWKSARTEKYKDNDLPSKVLVILVLDFIQITIAFIVHFFTYL